MEFVYLRKIIISHLKDSNPKPPALEASVLPLGHRRYIFEMIERLILFLI
jgi:hypothetical protein